MEQVNRIEFFEGEYFFLSNFYVMPMLWEGQHYKTVEHAFQAAKSLDPAVRAHFVYIDHPGNAKKAGRSVALRADWEQVKDATMAELLAIKFDEPEMRHRLLETGDRELIEGNYHHDNVWGDCQCHRNRVNAKFGIKEGCFFPGQNRLGKALMALRSSLQTTDYIQATECRS